MNSQYPYKSIKDDTLKNISGGGKATNTIISGLGGATAGVKACTIGGPWAMAGCGVVGAVVGGVIGYNAP